jgi:RNA polymerase sigma-32 factor
MYYNQENSSFNKYLVEISKYPLLSGEEELRLIKDYRKSKDIKIAHKLITSNLRIVVKIALQYRNYGIRLEDLIQEGNIGLMTAVEKYDPKKGRRLVYYAAWWIKSYIQRFVIKNHSLVKIGTTQTQRRLFGSIAKARSKLSHQYKQEPSNEVLARELGVTVKQLSEMVIRISRRDLSLDTPLDKGSHMDRVGSKEMNPEEIISKKQERDKVREALKSLPRKLKPREKVILKKRLLSAEPETLQEIGDRYNISRQRVKQIEQNVKRKVREHFTEVQLQI